MAHKFYIVREIRREYRRFGTYVTQLRLNPPTDPNPNPVDHLLASVNSLFEQAFQSLLDSQMMGIAIRNEINQGHKH
jgi:hypothetical protein